MLLKGLTYHQMRSSHDNTFHSQGDANNCNSKNNFYKHFAAWQRDSRLWSRCGTHPRHPQTRIGATRPSQWILMTINQKLPVWPPSIDGQGSFCFFQNVSSRFPSNTPQKNQRVSWYSRRRHVWSPSNIPHLGTAKSCRELIKYFCENYLQ